MTATISSLALWEASRISTSRTQSQLGETSYEVTSGRHYDVGIALGSETSRTIDARLIKEDMDSIKSMNAVAGQKLSTMQASMSGMLDLARNLFDEATRATQSDADRELFVASARSMLSTLTSLLSATSNGTYVFSGANSLSAPVADYLSIPPPVSRSAVIGAFAAEFGFAPDDAAVGGITPNQVNSYWSGAYGTLFEAPGWQSTFSSARDDPTELRIGPQEHAAVAVTANDTGIRRLYSALVAVVDSGAGGMNADSFRTLAGLVAEGAGAAAGGITRAQAALGELQGRIKGANDRMETQRNVLEKVIGGLEGVDQVEASSRLNSLTTQLQVSYAVTARMFKLSLLDYL